MLFLSAGEKFCKNLVYLFNFTFFLTLGAKVFRVDLKLFLDKLVGSCFPREKSYSGAEKRAGTEVFNLSCNIWCHCRFCRVLQQAPDCCPGRAWVSWKSFLICQPPSNILDVQQSADVCKRTLEVNTLCSSEEHLSKTGVVSVGGFGAVVQ